MNTNSKPKISEPMKPHAIRFTAQQWAEVLLVGPGRLRELVAKEAARLRKQQGSE